METTRQRAEQEERKLGGRFGQNVRGVGKRNAVTAGSGAINVVDPDSQLRNDAQRLTACGENFFIDLVAQCRDHSVDATLNFFDDDGFRRRLKIVIDFDYIAALAQSV